MKTVTTPLTVVISAFTSVQNVTNICTPTAARFEDVGEKILVFVDPALGQQAMGGYTLAQAMKEISNGPPDLWDVDLISDYFDVVS